MKRNLQKAISDYESRRQANTGNFYVSDFTQIRDIALKKYGDAIRLRTVQDGETTYRYVYTGDHLFIAIACALEAGYMVGYRKGMSNRQRG